MLNLQPDLSVNPFLWLQKRGQKDWEWKADKAALIIIIEKFVRSVCVLESKYVLLHLE